MGRKIDVDDLVSSVEISERLGYAYHTVVHQWRVRYSDFPEPVTRVGQVWIWEWPSVEKWARKTGRVRNEPVRRRRR